jgi:hypothetical protein
MSGAAATRAGAASAIALVVSNAAIASAAAPVARPGTESFMWGAPNSFGFLGFLAEIGA